MREVCGGGLGEQLGTKPWCEYTWVMRTMLWSLGLWSFMAKATGMAASKGPGFDCIMARKSQTLFTVMALMRRNASGHADSRLVRLI